MASGKTRARAFRAGFCAIVGRPNVGKSTLLNRLLGEKLAIVSSKPQTTRTRMLGVLTRPDVQVAFFDTPGIHRARGGLNRYMVEQALSAVHEVDVVLLLIEPSAARDESAPSGLRVDVGEGGAFILGELRRARKPVILAINKIDTVARPELLPIIDAWKEQLPFLSIVPISALEGENVDALLEAIREALPEGPALFDADVLTDVAERVLVAELVREQILRHAHQEVPYSSAVVVEDFDESEREERGLVRIFARIYVERDSQKAIVIGRGGQMLKKIGSGARVSIERLLGARVFLALEVTVEPRWSERPDALKRLGYA